MSSSPSTTTSASATSTTDPALAYWSLAASLISSYYPSTTITNISDLTFPATLVTGSSTIVKPTQTTTSSLTPTGSSSSSVNQAEQTNNSPSASATSAPSSTKHHSDNGDRELGIILGVVIGVVSIVLFFVLVCCLCRRRRRQQRLQERRHPSPSQTEIARDWQPETTEDPAYHGPPQMWLNMFNRPPGQVTPSMAKHPAFNDSRTEASTPHERRDPFESSQERIDARNMGLYDDGTEDGRSTLAAPDHEAAVSTTSFTNLQLPKTLYTTVATNSTSSSSVRYYTPEEGHRPQYALPLMDNDPVERHDQPSAPFLGNEPRYNEPKRPEASLFPLSYANSRNFILGDSQEDLDRTSTHRKSNPFSAQDDSDDDGVDTISPILPVKNPKRNSARQIHYPSWKEVASFNFASDQDSEGRRSLEYQNRAREPY